MAINPVWDGPTQVIGSGDGYIPLSGTTESFSSSVDMSSHDAAHVIVEVNFDATPTDDVDVKLYGSLDGTNFDDIPFSEIRIDRNVVDPAQISLFVDSPLYAFHIGAVQTGATNSHDVRAYVRRRNWVST